MNVPSLSSSSGTVIAPWAAAIEGARSKASGIFAPDLARVLLGASEADWKLVPWDEGPDAVSFVTDLHGLGEALLLSR